MIGGGVGTRIETQGEFERGLTAALGDSSRLYVMNVLLDLADRSAGMVRLAHRLAKRLSPIAHSPHYHELLCCYREFRLARRGERLAGGNWLFCLSGYLVCWFNQTNKTNQINQITVFVCWRTVSASAR